MALKRQALVEDAARVGERFEAGEAVRFADAAVADAAERQIELVEVDQRVVDGRAARAGARAGSVAPRLRSRLKM